MVTKVSPKVFIGKNVLHIDVFKKNDDRTIYNVIYRDGKKGPARVKRFPVKSITRDKEYDLTRGTSESKVLYFTANPNGEAEVIKVYLTPKPKLKKLTFEYDFSEMEIKSRSAQGNILTKKNIRRIVQREEGVSTLGAIDIWFDETVKRLNTEERGMYLGAFKSDDKILTIQKSGNYKLMSYELSNHFDEDMIHLEKFDPGNVVSAVYFDVSIERYYVKRFQIEDNNGVNKPFDFIGSEAGNRLLSFSLDKKPRIKLSFDPDKNKKAYDEEVVAVEEFIGIKSEKAKGKRLTNYTIKKIEFVEPSPDEPEEPEVKEALQKDTNPAEAEQKTKDIAERGKQKKGDPDPKKDSPEPGQMEISF
jgi:topoisomerase-4 subunit A